MVLSRLAKIAMLAFPFAISSVFAATPLIVPHPSSSELSHMDSETSIQLNGATFEAGAMSFTTSRSTVRRVEAIEPNSVHWPVLSNVPYRIEARKNPDGSILLSEPRLELLAKWKQVKNLLPAGGDKDSLETAIDKIPENSLSISEQLRPDLMKATLATFSHSPSGSQARDVAAGIFYLQNKSYRGNRQVPFAVFNDETRSCTATCAIERNGITLPHGSGVLIGNNLILTCGHNFDSVSGPTACHVRFGFVSDDKKGASFKIASAYYMSPEHDFCLLTLGERIAPAVPPFQMPACPRLQCAAQMDQNAGIYVAGHPGGMPLSIALNCQVVYPYWLKSEDDVRRLAEYSALQMFTSYSEFQQFYPIYAPKVLLFFTSSYRKNDNNNYNFCPDGFPTLGADPDTKCGDSGGPVFSVANNSLVGLLRAGVPDSNGNFAAGANYANFERVIPISAIVDELNNLPTTASASNWKSKFGVLFTDDPAN